jgi:hypothetical protein
MLPAVVYVSLIIFILGSQVLFSYVRSARRKRDIAALPARLQQLKSAQGKLTRRLLDIAEKGLRNARQLTLAGETKKADRVLDAAERCATLAEVAEGKRPPVGGKDGRLLAQLLNDCRGAQAELSFLKAFETAIVGCDYNPPWANDLDDASRLVDLDAADKGQASVFGTRQYKLRRRLCAFKAAASSKSDKVSRYIMDLAQRCDEAIRFSAYVSTPYQAYESEAKAEEQLKLMALLADPKKHHRLPSVIANDLAA